MICNGRNYSAPVSPRKTIVSLSRQGKLLLDYNIPPLLLLEKANTHFTADPKLTIQLLGCAACWREVKMDPYIKAAPSQRVQCSTPHCLHICGVLLIITLHWAKRWEGAGSPGLQQQLAFLYLSSPRPWGLAPLYLPNDFPSLASSARLGLEQSRVFDGISLSQSLKESLYLYYKGVGWFPWSPGHFACSLLSCGLKQMQINVGMDFPTHGSPEMDILKIKFQEASFYVPCSPNVPADLNECLVSTPCILAYLLGH